MTEEGAPAMSSRTGRVPRDSEDPSTHLVQVPSRMLRAAFIATVVGGILVSSGGVVLVAVSTVPIGLILTPRVSYVNALGMIGVLLGLMIILVGLNFRGGRRGVPTYGVVVVFLGVISLACGAGFLVGLALTVTGGLIAIATGPGPEWRLVPSSVRACPECGRLVSENWDRCPECSLPLD